MLLLTIVETFTKNRGSELNPIEKSESVFGLGTHLTLRSAIVDLKDCETEFSKYRIVGTNNIDALPNELMKKAGILTLDDLTVVEDGEEDSE